MKTKPLLPLLLYRLAPAGLGQTKHRRLEYGDLGFLSWCDRGLYDNGLCD